MKQKALYRFSRTALKGGYMEIFAPVSVITAVYIVYLLLDFSGAYFLCRHRFDIEAVLIWCAVRFLMKILTVLLTVRSRAAVIRRCIVRISLPCGYERSIYRRLRRLYILRGLMRFAFRIMFTGAFLFGVWLIGTDALTVSNVYRLMGAFQAVPAMAVILFMRLKLALCFAGAEVLAVSFPARSAWKSFCESCRMLSGQYRFILRIFIGNLPLLLMPFFLPLFLQTLVSYFSVRNIEWRYQENHYHEQANLHCTYTKSYEAGDIPAP